MNNLVVTLDRISDNAVQTLTSLFVPNSVLSTLVTTDQLAVVNSSLSDRVDALDSRLNAYATIALLISSNAALSSRIDTLATAINGLAIDLANLQSSFNTLNTNAVLRGATVSLTATGTQPPFLDSYSTNPVITYDHANSNNLSLETVQVGPSSTLLVAPAIHIVKDTGVDTWFESDFVHSLTSTTTASFAVS